MLFLHPPGAPLLRRALTALVLGMAVTGACASPALASARAGRVTQDLQARAAALFERRGHAMREGGIPLDPLQADLVAIAAQLEAARLDTLASDAHYYAANVLSRLARRTETDRELLYSIGDALKARDERRVMRGRLWQADLRAQVDPASAIRTAEEAIPHLRSRGWDGMLGNAYSTEARAYMEMGRAREAFVAARASAAHYAASKDQGGQLWALSQCSQALRYQDRHDEARVITDSVIAQARAARSSRALSRALLERATICRTSGRLPEALKAVNEALEEDRRRGDAATATTSRTFRAGIYMAMKRPRDCEAETDSLLDMPSVQGSINSVIHVNALRARALLALSRADDADTLLAGVAARYERFRATLANDEDRASVGEHATALFATWTRVKLALGRPEEGWQVGERGRAVALRARLGLRELPALRDVQAHLERSRAMMLVYDLADPEIGNVFRISADGIAGVALDEDLTGAELDAMLDACASLAPGTVDESAARRVSRVLLTGCWRDIDPGVDRLVVLPPAHCEKVPFEALPEPGLDPAHTLGRRYAISYAPSAAVLLALDRRPVPARGLTVLADPAVDAKQSAIASLEPALRGAVLRPLPGARDEARRLAQPGATLLLGRDATLARLLASPRAAVLHFATHAFDVPRAQAAGGLLLAGRPGLLTSTAIESLGVAADLVTLSGCSTLGSTAYSGEGTFGLARAFLVSGARSVVTTRWDVSDRAASRFMQVFYAELRTGQPRDAGLRRAREVLAREGFPARDRLAFLLVGVGDRGVAQWTASSGGESGPDRK